MSNHNYKNPSQIISLTVIVILAVLAGVGIVYLSRSNNQNMKFSEVNQSSFLVNENVNEAIDNKNVNSSLDYPSDWKKFQGEKLGFTIFIPPTWITTFYFEQFNRPDDPKEPASYHIASRLINDSMLEWTDEDVSIMIKKFRLHN